MKKDCPWLLTLPLLLAGAGPATEPATQPADPGLDWLLQHATTSPQAVADLPASKPAPVFNAPADKDHRMGVITFSDGEKIHTLLSTTAEKPVHIWVEEKKDFVDVPFSMIKSFEATVIWERDQPEWHFKASGSDIKEYSGKTYPARETVYTVTLVNDQKITGGIAAPIYIDGPDGQKTLILHKRDKGDVGQALKDLVYIQKIVFDEK